MMKFVDISGFGHSGKGVITDLLKEFKGYNLPNPNFEFNLLRVQGGLIDLKFALVDNWSPIRSDSAIRRFSRLVNKIGPRANILNPKSLFISNGMNYDKIFNEQFSNISYKYLDSLIDFQFEGEWPYQILDEPSFVQFIQRCQSRLRLKTHHTSKVNVTSISELGFITLTRKYLTELFNSIKCEHDEVMVTQNALEPFNPIQGLNFFENGKSIIVQRDPRDIYASLFIRNNAFIPVYETNYMWDFKINMLGANDIDQFCHRQSVYFSQTKLIESPQVLKLRYEEIVLDYQNTLKKIYNFLEIDESIHIKKGDFFNPQLSSKNIGLWKRMPDQTIISKIQSTLNPYCYYEK
jgi:hypothetical protein